MSSLDVNLTQRIIEAATRMLPQYKFRVSPRTVECVVAAIARNDEELAQTPLPLLRQAYPAIAAQITQAFENNPEPPPFEERMKGIALGPYTSTQEKPPKPIQVNVKLREDGTAYLNLAKAGFYVPDGKRKLQGYLKMLDFIDDRVKVINIQEYDVVWKRYSVEQHGFKIEEYQNGDALKITAPEGFTGTQRIQVASVLDIKQPGIIPLDITVSK